MVIIRKRDIKKLNRKQREDRILDLRKQMLQINGKLASGGSVSNPGRLRAIRRTIAQIITYDREQQGLEESE